MARVAYGVLSGVVEGLRQAVAGSVHFQGWLREADDDFPGEDDAEECLEAALERVHVCEMTAAEYGARPCALVCLAPDLALDSIAVADEIGNCTGVLTVDFLRDVPAAIGVDKGAAWLDFCGWQDGEDRGGLDAILEDIFGTDADGMPNIRGWKVISGPSFFREEERPRKGLSMGVCVGFWFGLKE